ncbi:hypothetical protein SBRCBS47491_004797 [Sporothrix bragantina]|uniref:Uncharacterized protein n=1 Tax=Sporothrix bragantina TaxID=671064 RepID=A0ABP0BRT1_9PEZI
MEMTRGRPPSAGRPHLFSSSGKVVTKEQKRSSSRSSILRRLSMSATNVLNGIGAPPATGAGAPARPENAGPAAAVQSTQSVEAQSPPSSSGKMSFKNHFRRSKKYGPGGSNTNVTGGAAGGSGGGGGVRTANAPMLNGDESSFNDVDTSPNVIHLDDSESDSDSESIIDDSYPISVSNASGLQPAAAESPVTTTGGTSARTSSFPRPDDQAKAAVAGKTDGGETTTFTVPGPPPPIVQLDTQSKKVITSAPAVPPKIPEPPPPAGANTARAGPPQGSTQNLQAVQSLQAIQKAHQERQQQQQQQQQEKPAASRAQAPAKLAKEPKEKGGGIFGGFKKLRRSDSRRETTDTATPVATSSGIGARSGAAQSTTGPGPAPSSQRLVSSHASPLTSTNQRPPVSQGQGQAMAPPAASQTQIQQLPPLATSLPPPPPPIQSSPDKGRAVDDNNVPASLRPGGNVPVQQYQHQHQQPNQYQQQPQQQQQQQQQQISHGYEHHSQQHPSQQILQQAAAIQQYHQQAPQQQQQTQHSHRVPCDECKAYYEAAWAQSEGHIYALSTQLAAAHQQSAGQIALLHERDAEIAELSGLVERLRTRIQEQVKQLEQVPAGLSGTNSFPGFNGHSAAGVGLLPDGQIRARWKSLRWQIRQCVEARLAALPSSTASMPVSPERAPFLRRLTPDYERFLRSRKGSVSLVEAAIWTVLAENVFSDARRASHMCWAARWSAPLAKINDNMLHSRPNDPAYHHWRVQTAIFVRSLEEKTDSDQQQQQSVAAPYVEAVVRQLEVEVGVLLALGTGGPSSSEDANGGPTGHAEPSSPSPTASSSSSCVLRRQLYDVVAEAIGLDADLCQQRPWYYVHYPTTNSGHRYGMPFDTREMENVAAMADSSSSGMGSGGSETNIGLPPSAHSNSNSAVSNSSQHAQDDVCLVVRPALFKAGNSRGEAYDQVIPLEPSIVCLAMPTGHGLKRWAGGRRDRSRSRG